METIYLFRVFSTLACALFLRDVLFAIHFAFHKLSNSVQVCAEVIIRELLFYQFEITAVDLVSEDQELISLRSQDDKKMY